MRKYLPSQIEKKWQKEWENSKIYEFNHGANGKSFYSLVELPYTSGDLHLGHWFAFVPPDCYARFKRMNGFNSFFPIGFDAFGLPAENAAIKHGIHPKDWTLSNIQTMTKQFKTIGTMLAWNHETISCEPKYYCWNQWIFLKMFERGIAYRGKALSNWCPVDQTVLANENIEDGRCWRCGAEVIQKETEQWFLKITDYADRLIWPENPSVDWPASVRVGQNSWIGKSEGTAIEFRIKNSQAKIIAYTVFPETIFGVTYMVLAPEHSLVKKVTTRENKKSISEYIEASKKKTEKERKSLDKGKTGVFTGAYCVNPANNQEVPIWVADYVICGYGTGAVMGVPGSDHRDFEFAKKYQLPIIRVIGKQKKDNSGVASEKDVLEEGVLVNSDQFSGLVTPIPAREKIKYWIEEQGFGKRQVQYHLHDWSVSRQRYWGTPVPIIHCPKCGLVPVPEEDLPVELPYNVDFTPRGKPPLASNEDWLRVKCPLCKQDAKREAETLDAFYDSSWYFFRYLDPGYSKGPFNTDLAKKMTPVDIYFGGAEHTLGHTLYARFFTKFFKDLGLITFEEFAKKRIQHGVILGPDGNRMSKSKGNVVNPDKLVKEYGADTVRLYLSFMMPYIETTAPFSPTAIAGCFRFLRRVWDLFDKVTNQSSDNQDLYLMHKTIKKVTKDIEAIKFNTAIAALMEWLNYLSQKKDVTSLNYEVLILLLAPFAPHITEELWKEMGHENSVHSQSWPKFEEKYLQENWVKIAVQINGKIRGIIDVSIEAALNESEVQKIALANEKISRYLDNKKPKKIIYIKNKILSLVI